MIMNYLKKEVIIFVKKVGPKTTMLLKHLNLKMVVSDTMLKMVTKHTMYK